MRLFLSLLLLAAASTLAQAADLRRPAAPATVVEYGWQGLYAGVNGGANLGSFSPVFGTGDEAKTVNLDDNSAFVGGHIGYLVQSGGLVIGPELGLQYWGFKSEGQVIAANPEVESPAVLLQQKGERGGDGCIVIDDEDRITRSGAPPPAESSMRASSGMRRKVT